MKLRVPLTAITLGMLALNAHGACPTDTETALMAARFSNLQPVPTRACREIRR